MKRRLKIDKVRASRDGHEFHEAWASRKALQLLMPADKFVGIAVEGLALSDQADVSAQAIEVADLVMYYGERPVFDAANSVVITQVKYSRGAASLPFRASDAKKTIRKFAAAFNSHKTKYGAKSVESKLAFELITNRPIHHDFSKAIAGLALGGALKGNVRRQANQFKAACRLKGKHLAQFAAKLATTGLAGNLTRNKQRLARALADWSAAPDAMARARLGNIRQLLRDKAGLVGQRDNVITRVDVMDALELQGPEDLLPCPDGFPEVGRVVDREQLPTLVSQMPTIQKPLLIHADGGVGKTVFLQSLARILGDTNEIVLFDCFGGGAYRSPNDGRHLPKRGLVHIANSLACKGLCDPLLPVSEHVHDLVKAFRTRLAQVIATLQRGSRGKQLFLLIDAIDNAAEQARDKGEDAFPKLLLESFHYSGPVPGAHLIVSCRSYRRQIARGDVPCEEFKLEAFTPAEAAKYLRDRIPSVTDTQVRVAYSRSQGNPRVLEHLALSDRGLLDASELNSSITLDDLLKQRIQTALSEAARQGYPETEINAFLAGLSVLPPPVPLDEYADAHGMQLSAIKSFAADLAPLLEQTKHGLMFRDEPTETLVRQVYAANSVTLRTLADNLLRKQGTSVYAASSLPGLLQMLDDGTSLFNLAFDDRFPTTIPSAVGRQNIRYARLKAAVLHAARHTDYDRLVRLVVELSTLAAHDERGTDYIVDNPDLVVIAHDLDATRRLFETRSNWPGTRHARLAIANVLSGDLGDAYRHAVSASEWIQHFYGRNEEYRRERGGPKRLDVASLPLCLVAQNRGRDAVRYMKGWKEWYAYEVAEDVFALLQQAEKIGTVPPANIRRFLESLKTQRGLLAAALSFMELDNSDRRRLITRLAKACKQNKAIAASRDYHPEREYLAQDGLFKGAALALAMKMRAGALAILTAAPVERPRIWSFTDPFADRGVLPYVIWIALKAATERRPVTARELLPQDLTAAASLCAEDSVKPFCKALKAEIERNFETQKELPQAKKTMSYDTKREAERFIEERAEPLLEMSDVLAKVLASPYGGSDIPFLNALDVWGQVRMPKNRYSAVKERDRFFDALGRQILVFALWTRSDLQASSVRKLIEKVADDDAIPASVLITMIAVLAKRPNLHELAGKLAVRAKAIIEREDDVAHRASLFARLARAMTPASFDEAASYFRSGLEQMDAIGSGDYQFTNELLSFAAELKGSELDESEFHTLSNICELNMSSEEEKFPWLAFARGLARTSGCRTLAKLGRWEDRDKVSLDYTLLPYLAALIEQDKIDPSLALVLLRISDPAELFVCGTEQLGEVIAGKEYDNKAQLLSELISQFEDNHPGVFMPSTLATLEKISGKWGVDSGLRAYLAAAAPKFEKLRDENNENQNYRGPQDPRLGEVAENREAETRHTLERLERETDPADEASMSRLVDALNNMQRVFGLKREFFAKLRTKLKYDDRSRYVHIVAGLDALDMYTKLHELQECKAKWTESSSALQEVFQAVGLLLVRRHPEEFVEHGYLSGSTLKEIAALSGSTMAALVLELIAAFAAPDAHLQASIWMGLAAIICENAKQGEGQVALTRLLNSGSAKLASTVVDGPWKEGLYPKEGETSIAAGLMWLALGSPAAATRWQAAHSLRACTRLGRWDVIDALFERFHSANAHPYQAPELSFYFLHARLWFLIAVARLALDYPEKVAKYADALEAVVLDESFPHVLFRHFAAASLLACVDKGSLALSSTQADALRRVNESPFEKKTQKGYPREGFYRQRPSSAPEPNPEFHLDYDFNKTEVSGLSGVFERPGWETSDAMTAWVRKYDPKITGMYEAGGRPTRHRDRGMGMSARYHGYGHQLGWHALYLVAGEYLAKYPVVQRQYDSGDSWHDWLKREVLTRKDGLWLADGVDRPPVDAQVNLMEKSGDGLAITGGQTELLGLLNIRLSVGDDLVVAGDWSSVDGITIHINSALAPPKKADALARSLSREDPIQAWLPRTEAYDAGEEYSHSESGPYTPWIVWPSMEGRLDDTDSLGVISAVRRLYFAEAINAVASLKPADPFRRKWVDTQGRVAARSEAWSQHSRDEAGETNAERLVCSASFLKDVLTRRNAELVILVVLRRYDKGFGSEASKFWHTMAVVRLNSSMDIQFYPGVVNKLHTSKY